MATTPLPPLTSAAPGGLARSRRRGVPWRHLAPDPALAGATLAAAALGTLMVHSVARSAESASSRGFLSRQLVVLAAGLVALVLSAALDYRKLRALAPLAWLGSLVLLAAVLSPLGTEVNSARSWFAVGAFQVQPSELAKVALILALAAAGASGVGTMPAARLFGCLALAGVPAALVFVQPDLGTTLVYVAIVLGVLLVASARLRHLAAVVTLGLVGAVGLFSFTDLVEDYQRDRLTAFAVSEGGASSGVEASAGYSLDQAKTAIAAGGVRGAGLFNGTQTKGRFVPEQQTDFVFTVVGEELGFLGSASLLALYGVMVWRVWLVAGRARDNFGRLLCVGVLAALVFQIFENIGMTLGIMPITGIPLPFLSYGGSSLVTMSLAVGLVLSVDRHRWT